LAAAIEEAITNQSLRQKAAALSRKIEAEDGTETAVKMIEAILDGSGQP
jgi:UDP:flavonoid glycosyltransferase YjiC (YdhE family)